jgi:hypothetical protein
MKTVFIYYLHAGDYIPFYIGKTKNLKNRLREHKTIKGECFIEILEEVNINEWLDKEKFYIKKYIDLGYKLVNQNLGGGGSKIGTKKHTELSKQKLKEKCILTNLPIEYRNKIYTEERNKKISQSLKNRKFTPSHINKLSLAKQNKLSNSSKKIIQFDMECNFIKEWNSITEAKKYIGKGDIQSCVLGKQKTAGGFIWKYKN